jgi:hypothetical protein
MVSIKSRAETDITVNLVGQDVGKDVRVVLKQTDVHLSHTPT